MAIIHAHADGTRYGIGVDPADGLLRAGEPGTQLTWMDARHGDHAFTPRIGKPVEINALWLNALDVTARLAARAARCASKNASAEPCCDARERSFGRFWNEERSCLFDVHRCRRRHRARCPRSGPIRSWPWRCRYCALSRDQMRARGRVLCAATLLTSYGLRSLSPGEPGYVGRYVGDPRQRDARLSHGYGLGLAARALRPRPLSSAWRCAAGAVLSRTHRRSTWTAACLGTVSEIFDGDAPHSARGCFAQAWSVAEILRSWLYLERKISST